MMWKEAERVERHSGPCYEDRANGCGPLAWILDGASAVSEKRLTAAASDALWLVDRLDAELEELAHEAMPLTMLVAGAIRRTAARSLKEWVEAPLVPPSAALGVVRQAGDCTEYLVLADVSVVLATDMGVREVTDDRVDAGNHEARARMTGLVAGGHLHKDAHRQVLPLLRAHREQSMNRERGYWVASTDERAVEHALVGAVEDVHEVVLATDGFMRAVNPFGLIPGPEALFEGVSLNELADRVRAAEADDPETRSFPRWTTSDDICAVRLRWVD
jgi:hypothetical protein